MKSFRMMRAGVKLLEQLEPHVDTLSDTCPECGAKVLLWFDNDGPRKPYYPTHESCTAERCTFARSWSQICDATKARKPVH